MKMDTSGFFAYPGETVAAPAGLLGQASARDWEVVLSAMQTLSPRAGEPICEEGLADRSLYLLSTGAVELREPGSPQIRLTAPPAETFNEAAFLDGGPCLATVRAVGAATVLRLSYDAFEAFAAREPRLAWRLALDVGAMVSRRNRRPA